MTLQPFRLPLNPAQFASALQKGQGRVLIHAQKFGLDGNESVVVNACLHNQAYDPQCEGHRADWLLDVASADTAGRVVLELIDRLGDSTPEFWDASLRCAIAFRLTQRGYTQARNILYGALRKWPDTADIIGEQEIIELDGIEGLLRVAEFHGSLIRQHLESSSDDNPLVCFDEIHGEGAGRRLLNSAATHSPLIAEYLDHLDAQEVSAAGEHYLGLAERNQGVSAEEVICEIETEDPERNRFWFSVWGRHALESERLKVLEAMLLQSNAGRLCKYLRVFDSRALRLFDRRLLQYADHEDAAVRETANKVLSNYQHPEVRELAIRRVSAGQISGNELRLLKANYRISDAKFIEPLLLPLDEPEAIHKLVIDLVNLYEANHVPESQSAMLFAYENSPCSNCRYSAVAILATTDQLLPWVRDECSCDSSDEIRALANTAKTVD